MPKVSFGCESCGTFTRLSALVDGLCATCRGEVKDVRAPGLACKCAPGELNRECPMHGGSW